MLAMKKIKKLFKNTIIKYGHIIAGCALAFITVTSNSSSILIFFEPTEPEGLEKFKKFNK